jgi:hypothetical protein
LYFTSGKYCSTNWLRSCLFVWSDLNSFQISAISSGEDDLRVDVRTIAMQSSVIGRRRSAPPL